MAKKKSYPRPSDETIREVIAEGLRLLKTDRRHRDGAYRRGMVKSLQWVLGENDEIEQLREKWFAGKADEPTAVPA